MKPIRLFHTLSMSFSNCWSFSLHTAVAFIPSSTRLVTLYTSTTPDRVREDRVRCWKRTERVEQDTTASLLADTLGGNWDCIWTDMNLLFFGTNQLLMLQYKLIGKSTDSRATLLGFKSQLCHLTSCVTSGRLHNLSVLQFLHL